MTGRQRLAATLGALLLVTGARCGSADKHAPATVSKPRTSPSVLRGQSYTTQTFVLPLTVAPPNSEGRRMPAESTNRLTWPAVDGAGGEIGFLVPVLVYPPGSTAPVTPPADYAGYLRGLSRSGVQLNAEKTLSVDGHTTTLLTATASSELDGAVGCPQFGSERRLGCVGLGPTDLLRLGIVDVDGITLLVWARTGRLHPNAHLLLDFETMLRSIRFR